MLKRAYALCGQMTHFFAQLRLYLTFEALEPAWLTMQIQMRSATSLDQAGHPTDMHAVHLRWVSAQLKTPSGSSPQAHIEVLLFASDEANKRF